MKSKKHKDSADSLVSAVLVLPLILAVLFTMLDFSIYSGNRGMITNAARDSARTVAIFGGNGNNSLTTPIAKAYGSNDSCKEVENIVAKGGRDSLLAKAYHKGTSTPTECTLMKVLNGSGLVNVEIASVKCLPTFTDKVGNPVSCSVRWSFNGLPGSGLALARVGKDVVTVGTAESEVQYEYKDLISR